MIGNTEQWQLLLQRLRQDYDFRDDDAAALARGRCPHCGKQQLSFDKRAPWRLVCTHRQGCGFVASVFALYQHSIFADWSQYYPPDPAHPHATADAYLTYACGFDPSVIQGFYRQEYYCGAQAAQRTATVRFALANGQTQWEWFLDHAEQFAGQTSRILEPQPGMWWHMPDTDPASAETVWITDSIFEALSLHHAGLVAIACLDAAQDLPEMFASWRKQQKMPALVFAFSNMAEGGDAARQYARYARKLGMQAQAALPPAGRSWNDLWRCGQLTEQALSEARQCGDLLLADSAAETAAILYRQCRLNHFPFTYAHRTYWFALNAKIYQEALQSQENHGQACEASSCHETALQQAMHITEIANCTFTPLYFQRDRYNLDAYYFVRIARPHGHDVQSTFTGNQLASAGDFKKRLLSVSPGALYEGSGKQLDSIIRAQFTRLRTVDTIDHVGYVPELDAWIYRDFAVCRGKLLRSNAEQFIAMDGHRAIKTLCDIVIQVEDHPLDTSPWLSPFWQAFAERGMIALAFFTGSLFVNQIREVQKSWPFLEITGDAGTGKSTLLEFLWRLLGRQHYEGFDPGKSSFVGRARGFNKVSGMPVVLIESDRDANLAPNKRFDFAELKDLYNGRPIYTRGAATAGLETYDPPFRASIVIAQNAPVEGDEAILSRTLPLRFKRKELPAHGKTQVDLLNRLSMDKLSPYLLHMLRNSKALLAAYFAAYPEAEQRLQSHPRILMPRIAQNGAQLMAMLKGIAPHIGMDDIMLARTLDYLEQASIERQQSLAADPPVLIEFWESMEYLDTREGSAINHSHDAALIAINLPHAEACAKAAGLQLPPRTELQRLLPQSRRHAFLDRRTVHSRLLHKKVKCLVFRKRTSK